MVKRLDVPAPKSHWKGAGIFFGILFGFSGGVLLGFLVASICFYIDFKKTKKYEANAGKKTK